MAFLADISMLLIFGSYLWLNRRLYVWRLMVTDKYPHRSRQYKSFRADFRGMWELIVSIVLLSILLTCLFIACYWPIRFGHSIVQAVILVCVLYWTYTFVSIATYPDSHQLFRWMRKRFLTRHPQ